MKARFGHRGLKTQGALNPPSTEILALNPSPSIVHCRGDFSFPALWPCSFFLMGPLFILCSSLCPFTGWIC